MKTEQPILITTVKAKVDLAKNLFVAFDGDICGNAAKALGVSNAESDLGEQAPVTAKGIALVLSGNAITQGDKIQSDANGKAIPFASGEVNGFALDAATGADEAIRVMLV